MVKKAFMSQWSWPFAFKCHHFVILSFQTLSQFECEVQPKSIWCKATVTLTYTIWQQSEKVMPLIVRNYFDWYLIMETDIVIQPGKQSLNLRPTVWTLRRVSLLCSCIKHLISVSVSWVWICILLLSMNTLIFKSAQCGDMQSAVLYVNSSWKKHVDEESTFAQLITDKQVECLRLLILSPR